MEKKRRGLERASKDHEEALGLGFGDESLEKP